MCYKVAGAAAPEAEPTDRLAVTVDKSEMVVGLEPQCNDCHDTVLLRNALPADRCKRDTPLTGPTFLKESHCSNFLPLSFVLRLMVPRVSHYVIWFVN